MNTTLHNKNACKTQKAELLDAFLRSQQEKAFCLAMRTLGSRDDAMDVVQDAMFRLVDRYSNKPESDWAPLFYRILFNGINDVQRRGRRWGFLFSNNQRKNADEEFDWVATIPDQRACEAEQLIDDERTRQALKQALANLPERQRQAFTMRAWVELDVRQTAQAMQCSEGSVKTHYARARQAIKQQLQSYRAE